MARGYKVQGTMPARRFQLQQDHPLRLWRLEADLSQEQVAEACDLTQATISYIESGKKVPRGEVLERLRAYTGLPTDAFVRWRHFLTEEPNFLRKYRRRPGGNSSQGQA